MKPYKICIITNAHVGSTLLTNIVYGLFCPNKSVEYLTDNFHNSEKPVFKTHNLDFNSIKNELNDFKIIFLTIDRENHNKVDFKDLPKNEYFRFNYEDLVQDQSKFIKNIIKELSPILEHNVKKRINDMNNLYEEIKEKPFKFYNGFYHIHGSHRNRKN